MSKGAAAMRILMFGWEFPPRISGGLGTACHGLSSALAAAGQDVCFVLPGRHRPQITPGIRFLTAAELLGTEYLSFEGASPYNPSYACRSAIVQDALPSHCRPSPLVPISYRVPASLAAGYERVGRKAAQVCSFEIIHCHDWMTVGAGLAARRFSGKPLLLQIHSLEIDRCGRNADPHIEQIERCGLKEADRIIAVSQISKNRLVEHYRIAEEKVAVLYNGVDAPGWNSPRRPAAPLRNPLVSFVGRLSWQKGPDRFLQVARRIRRRMPGARFVMAGDGELLPTLKTEAARLHLPVAFPGFLTHQALTSLLSLSDVMIMPSRFEPFGIAALEAAAAGVPVVLSSTCGVREVLPGALLAKPDTASGLASAALRLLESPGLRQFHSRCNLAAVQSLSWTKAAASLSGIYRDQVRAGAPSGADNTDSLPARNDKDPCPIGLGSA
jgi:glycosyltransferase involved in cell wall biosynthesis